MTKQKKTNEEFIRAMMMFSKHGALIQGFVFSALKAYSEQVVVQDKAGKLAQEAFGMVNKDAWVGCAVEVLDKINLQLGQDQ